MKRLLCFALRHHFVTTEAVSPSGRVHTKATYCRRCDYILRAYWYVLTADPIRWEVPA